MRPPPLHVVVPAAQVPRRPVLHAAPPPGLPSSVTPSQSLSTPSHSSVEGDAFCTHTSEPFWQDSVPKEHTPGRPVLHVVPPPGLPLSTTPSQSSSALLHVSALGGESWTQVTDPAKQAVTPKIGRRRE